jgi:cobalt/nickel transport system permease protein
MGVSITNPFALSGMIAICLVLLRRDFLCVLKRLIPLETFSALFLFQTLFGFLSPGTALILILRVNAAALLYMLMVIPLGLGTFAQALGALGVSPKLVSILFLSYRYIYLMHDKVIYSVRAMRLRQSPHQKGTLVRWKSCAAVFAAALAGAFVTADRVSAALVKRGFNGAVPQTVQWEWKARDTVFVLFCCGGLVFYGTYTVFGHLLFL